MKRMCSPALLVSNHEAQIFPLISEPGKVLPAEMLGSARRWRAHLHAMRLLGRSRTCLAAHNQRSSHSCRCLRGLCAWPCPASVLALI